MLVVKILKWVLPQQFRQPLVEELALKWIIKIRWMRARHLAKDRRILEMRLVYLIVMQGIILEMPVLQTVVDTVELHLNMVVMIQVGKGKVTMTMIKAQVPA